MMHIVAIVNFVMWAWLGFISFQCSPSFFNDEGKYRDECDFVTIKELETVAPDVLKPAVVVYKPLCWLIEPDSDDKNAWWTLSMSLWFAISVLLFVRILNQSDNFTWRNGVMYSIDIVLNLYLIGFLLF